MQKLAQCCKLQKWFCIIFFAFVMSLFLGISRPYSLERLNHQNDTPKKRPQPGATTANQSIRQILLDTTYRSGSTILENIFNLNPTAHYLSEPLKLLDLKSNPERYQYLQENSASYLSDAFKCHYEKLYTDSLKFHPNEEELFNTWIDRIFLQPQSRLGRFGERSRSLMENTCQSYKTRVQKIVRMDSLKPLLSLLSTTNADIIVLFRDPRGNARAIFEAEVKGKELTLAQQADYMVSKATAICDKFKKAIQILKAQKTLSARQRLFAVRSEDLSYRPRATAQNIYEQLHLPYPRSLELWVSTTTDSPNARASRKAAENWRLKVEFATTQRIQKVCGDVMQMLGYASVTSNQQQHNMNTSLVIQPSDVMRQYIIQP